MRSRRIRPAGCRRTAVAASATTAPRFRTTSRTRWCSTGDVIYLLSTANRRVYRWSISGRRLSQSLRRRHQPGLQHGGADEDGVLGASPAPVSRYATGAIRYHRRDRGQRRSRAAFVTMSGRVDGLTSAGNYLLAQDRQRLHRATATTCSTAPVSSRDREWVVLRRDVRLGSGHVARVLLPRQFESQRPALRGDQPGHGPDHGATGETPYHGAYSIQPPIRVSANGQYVLLGSGDIYAQNGLTWSGSLGHAGHRRALVRQWLAGHAGQPGNQTTLRRLGAHQSRHSGAT